MTLHPDPDRPIPRRPAVDARRRHPVAMVARHQQRRLMPEHAQVVVQRRRALVGLDRTAEPGGARTLTAMMRPGSWSAFWKPAGWMGLF